MKVLIADDHALVRESISLVLQSSGNIEVVQAANMEEAARKISDERPLDLVLLDFGMPGVGGIAGLKKIFTRFKDQRIAVLSGTASKSVIVEALGFGAAGFVPKTLSADAMVHAVKLMATGERYLPISFMTASTSDEKIEDARAKLTPREMQALLGLCDGLSNKEIAQMYGVQEVTVKLHVKTLCRKLGARNRTHAAMLAKELGII